MILTYRKYLKKRFGKPVLKIPINGGFSCPNRDGTISKEGCSFCDNRSFSPVAQDSTSVLAQLKRTTQNTKTKYELYLAYLQPFTNTYGPLDYVKQVYEPLIAFPGVVGLAVGTRPDCLKEETCNYLTDVAQRTYLCVELGLQSASDKTLAIHNRGHTWKDFTTAVEKLAKRNIQTVVHMLIGLPGDTRESIICSAKTLATLPVHGIKLHQLMAIQGTKAGYWYQQGKLELLRLEEYAQIVKEFVHNLRPDQCIHRLMADSKPEYGLLGPSWSSDKMRAISYIRSCLDKKT